MAEWLDQTFREILRDIGRDIKQYSNEERRTVAGWLKQIGKEIQNNEDRQARNEYARYIRYIVQSGADLPADFSAICTNDLEENRSSSTTLRGPCPRKDVIAQLGSRTDSEGIKEVCEQVANGEITTAAEFIFSITPYVSDRAGNFREILDKDLNFFREIVEDTVERRVQDEADVMMNTQNDIKQKFHNLTDAMLQRTMRIRQRLLEVAPRFDWAANGKNKAKIAKLITVKRNEMSGDPHVLDKLIHQVFMRGQWLKKELNRLQEENGNLQKFLNKFRLLAAERKAQESHIPKLLCKEKKILEDQLSKQRRTYKRNLETIDALYVEHHRCIKPSTSKSSVEEETLE
ncbi:uncharacterized protein LOC107274847 [Cephus cinctus]|uniref:Uncharacterized protein LOC107274847 n=1 Tax=Cephus cinctus TaxID=211228 RepID=A0AAJ7VW83_CEPCN|nr:uncharacterized protein LOC107274847 [Cephus cinctus]